MPSVAYVTTYIAVMQYVAISGKFRNVLSNLRYKLRCCAGVFQRQRVDIDTDNDNWRRDSAAGADPGRGSRHETRAQLRRHAVQARQMQSRHDAGL